MAPKRPPVRILVQSALLLALSVLAACSEVPLLAPTATPVPPTATPSHSPTPLPDPQPVAQTFLEAWKGEDYRTMYLWLTPLSQEAHSLESFSAAFRVLGAIMTLHQLRYEFLSTFAAGRSAQVSFRLQLNTLLVGEITRDIVMNLSLEGDQWRIQWERSLILPELQGGNTLLMEHRIPSRGDIYDRSGSALVSAETNAVSLGLIKGGLDSAQEAALFDRLWTLTGVSPEAIQEDLDLSLEGWYVPIGQAPASEIQAQFETLQSYEGLVMEPYTSRYYFGSGIAPQVLGYVSLIQPEEAEVYRRLGYRADERIGRIGLERWGEPFLSGTRGGALYAITSEGQRVTLLAEADPQPAQSIFTTLDKNLQVQAQLAMQGFTGAAVILERDTGRVLAMVSSPGFDPNIFEPTNFNSEFLLSDLLGDPRTPLLNRATQGQYPLGSVFKIVTMAAAMESGQYNANSSYYCGSYFTEIPGLRRADWTVSYQVPPSGPLTLTEGLMRSCNPWFWHIGLDFYNQGQDSLIADMATGFGLGTKTGIQQIAEEPGSIPSPINPIDAINLAIGQGGTLVTPLQVANFIAAIGNGGEVLRPQIIESIVNASGDPIFAFKPEPLRTLPIQGDTLEAIRRAMGWVVSEVRGTAFHRFRGLDIPVAGKTGTAEAPPSDPHAWFAGYTLAEDAGRPDVAIVVVAEHAGEGSAVAAPIFRRLVEIYFFGSPETLYPWETALPPLPPASEQP